jgi:photosynthetic reaction center H subunit
MQNVVIAGNIDIAMLALWAFFLFFFALVVYLHRESYREGYPLEDARTGKYTDADSLLPLPQPKTFYLPFNRGTVTVPQPHRREPVDIAGHHFDAAPGAPYVPTGNPLIDGMGPAAWAERARVPDLDAHGHPRIVPLATTDLWLESRDPDPRGMTVFGLDEVEVGTVSEVWVDRAERLVRYLAVDTGTRSVLVPITMTSVGRKSRVVKVTALLASQFADAPAIAAADQITFYEEERIQAYFGGGYLYATIARQEPLL